MKNIFIAGTNTGVGKTVVTRYLYTELKRLGHPVTTQKWIQTGTALGDNDLVSHGLDHDSEKHLGYSFKHPSSPHLAAALENTPITLTPIKAALEELTKSYSPVLVEGSGGLCVPISDSEWIIDWVEQLHLPVILVVGNVLGCLNHTFLSLAYLKTQNIPCLGYVVSDTQPDLEPLISASNITTLQAQATAPCLGHIPYSETQSFPEDLLDLSLLS